MAGGDKVRPRSASRATIKRSTSRERSGRIGNVEAGRRQAAETPNAPQPPGPVPASSARGAVRPWVRAPDLDPAGEIARSARPAAWRPAASGTTHSATPGSAGSSAGLPASPPGPTRRRPARRPPCPAAVRRGAGPPGRVAAFAPLDQHRPDVLFKELDLLRRQLVDVLGGDGGRRRRCSPGRDDQPNDPADRHEMHHEKRFITLTSATLPCGRTRAW